MKYILTTIETYNDFLKENKTDKLSKYYKLYVPIIHNNIELNEIFDSNFNLIEGKDFLIEKYFSKNKFTNYIYYFDIDNISYRLDFVFFKNNIKEKNKDLHNKIFISISFGLKESKKETYDIPTNLDKQYKILNYIIFLIKHFKMKINEDIHVFMFGDSKDDRKIDIYQYILYKCFKDYKIIKDITTAFSNTNNGYYLLKNN